MKDLTVRNRESVRSRDWAGILSRYHECGSSIRAFSEKEGIPASTLRDRLGLNNRKKNLELSYLESWLRFIFLR